MKAFLLCALPLAFALFSCTEKPLVVVDLSDSESFAAENADIVITSGEGWESASESEKRETERGLLVFRAWHVPRADALSRRRDATLDSCLNGEEELVPLAELDAPYIALRVDGLTVADNEYPLVKVIRTEFRVMEKTPRFAWFFGKTRSQKRESRVAEKIAALKEEALETSVSRIESAPRVLWIAAGGDVMLGRGALDILAREGPAGIFGGTADLIKNADISVINLEGVISSRGEKIQKSYNFRFAPAAAPALKNAGINAVLHANNHVFDYGMDAFTDSLAALKAAGIGALGAGNTIEEAAAAYEIVSPNGTARLFGIASFPREQNWDGASAAARQNLAGMLFASRGGADKLKENLSEAFDIVFFHGGAEWSTSPDARTRELYTGLIDAGADLVIGSHPHVTQGFEWINGKAVFWSLGNFVFGGMDGTAGGEQGLFVSLGYAGKKLAYLEPEAVALKGSRAVIAPRGEPDIFYARSQALPQFCVSD
ncbi:MAG: hypothetical protein Pg6C_12840 [Treponemataceae bacterium]|nr:MAG: hypothetical protein Pg6C_12840 [Treponemataceae bacterium]